MNKEYAIKVLDKMHKACTYLDDIDGIEALSMAIDALSVKPYSNVVPITDDRPQKPSNVYYGTLDVKTGELTITKPNDLINRAEAVDAIRNRKTEHWTYSDIDYNDGLESAIEAVETLPSAERVGEWIYDPNAYDYGLPAWKCDQCGCVNANIPPNIRTKDSKPNYAPVNPNAFDGSNFCPNCGARMEKRGVKNVY